LIAQGFSRSRPAWRVQPEVTRIALVLGVAAVPYIAASRGQALLAELELFRWAKPALRVERPSFQRHKDRFRVSLLIMVRMPRPRQRGRDPHCVLSLGGRTVQLQHGQQRHDGVGSLLGDKCKTAMPGDGRARKPRSSPLLAESGGRGRRGAAMAELLRAGFRQERLSGRADPRCGSQRATMCALTSETARGIQAPVVT